MSPADKSKLSLGLSTAFEGVDEAHEAIDDLSDHFTRHPVFSRLLDLLAEIRAVRDTISKWSEALDDSPLSAAPQGGAAEGA